MTKVVILAGGRGTRLKEKTEELPKPMLTVGDRPIIQHIIDNYRKAEYNEFIIPVGYLGIKVAEYFADGSGINIVDWGKNVDDVFHRQYDDYVVDIIHTGAATQTGGRLGRLRNVLHNPFLMTYGDGISNINPKVVEICGVAVDKNLVTAVHPVPRFGTMVIDPTGEVVDFGEKIINPHDWINGGFMYLKPDIFDLIDGDDCNFEKDVMPKLAVERKLHAYQYEGYWHCIDTLRDLEKANEDFQAGKFEWIK